MIDLDTGVFVFKVLIGLVLIAGIIKVLIKKKPCCNGKDLKHLVDNPEVDERD
jgi:hypothetical protein